MLTRRQKTLHRGETRPLNSAKPLVGSPKPREAAERAAAEAAEAAAQAARKAEEEAREARRVEQARLDAAAVTEREEALLAIRRAGRNKKKRKGH